MGVEFVGRELWRSRGRPPTPPDPAVVSLLRQCAERPNVMVRYTLDDGDGVEEIRKTVTQLRAAARYLGLVLHVQPRRAVEIRAAGAINFYVEEGE